MTRSRLALACLALAAAGCSQKGGEFDRPAAEPAQNSSSSQPAPAQAADSPQATKTRDEAKAVDIGKLTAAMDRLVQDGRFEEASRLVNEALKVAPDDRKLLFLAAALPQDIARKVGRPQSNRRFHQSAQAARWLRKSHKDLNPMELRLFEGALVNEAATYVVEDKPEQAIDALAEASDAGCDLSVLLDEPKDLEPLREIPRFQELRDRVVAKLTARASEQARALLMDNRSFPLDFRLPDLDDKTVASADLRGKVAIVTFWGTWCPPCRMEIPHLVALYRKYHDKGLEVIGLNYEQVPPEDVKPTIRAFVKAHDIPYTCLIGDAGTQAQVPAFGGFPTTLILGRDGRVRARLVGYDPGQGLMMEEIVKTLLDEDAPETTSNP
jgi:thiol-disulfide isomerase/thioredoxin/Arc/MetJ-type ribon-helix-helix transcriptional regulator